VGLALAKGLSFALKIPALGFSTLAVLAAGMESGYVAPLIDAKHKEIFTALYLVAENVVTPLSPVYAVDPKRLGPVLRDLAPKGETIKVIGPGVSLIAGAESLNWLDVGQDQGPSAVRLSALAFDAYQKGDEARCPLIPLYGRSPAIFKTYRPPQRLSASKE
jgi:tRNA A37 threonylcarbamoyladenosine modification protein TsaB